MDKITSAQHLLSIINSANDDRSHDYYLLEDGAQIIISNVPKNLYTASNLQKYITPGHTSELREEIPWLIENLNNFQTQLDGSAFKLRECYKNSFNVFEILSQINNNPDLSIITPVKIVFGYVSTRVMEGTMINDNIVCLKNVLIHDWHVWNYLDQFLLDTTLFKNQTSFNYLSETPTSWGDANDHVLINPPTNIDYYGMEFENYEECEKKFKSIFNE